MAKETLFEVEIPESFTTKHIQVSVKGTNVFVSGSRRTKVKATGEKRFYAFDYVFGDPRVGKRKVEYGVEKGRLFVRIKD